MSVTLEKNVIMLAGECGAEEAEALLSLIQANPDIHIDIGRAQWIHTALWQVIMAQAPQVMGKPSNEFIQKWLLPLVSSNPPDAAAS